jgi:hypothetical protein
VMPLSLTEEEAAASFFRVETPWKRDGTFLWNFRNLLKKYNV